MTNWNWREADVDAQGEHIELRYGDADTSDYEQWIPIALIGKPTNNVFPIQWLPSASVNPEIISKVQRELDFYLVEHPKEFPGTGHPWEYAIYHCNTAANMYSSVHWSYFPNGSRGERHSSSVIQLSDGSKAIFKPAR
jgi:hypothetical protein